MGVDAWLARRFPTAVNLGFLDGGAATFSFKYLHIYPQEGRVDPVQDPLLSENLVAPGIEPGPLDL
jgi:hypothetical protein